MTRLWEAATAPGSAPQGKCHPSHPRAGSTQCHARAGLEQPPCHPVRVSWRCGSIDTTGIGEHYTTALPQSQVLNATHGGWDCPGTHHLPSCFPTGIHLGWGRVGTALPSLFWIPAQWGCGPQPPLMWDCQGQGWGQVLKEELSSSGEERPAEFRHSWKSIPS